MNDFIYGCFLNGNSQKLRHYLLMTVKRNAPVIGTMHGDVIVADFHACYGTSRYFYYKQRKDMKERGFIDCIKNEELFKAISAVRKHSDIHQWFLNPETGEWKLSDKEKFDELGFRKAMKDDLIEHFKKKTINNER